MMMAKSEAENMISEDGRTDVTTIAFSNSSAVDFQSSRRQGRQGRQAGEIVHAKILL
jgi:hypothetical protein